MGILSESLPIVWFDGAITVFAALLLYLLYRGKRLAALALISSGYLFFLLSWGLNYQRLPLADRLGVEDAVPSPEQVAELAHLAAGELNRLYSEEPTGEETQNADLSGVDDAVRRASFVIDGTAWTFVRQPRTSVIFDPFLRLAGIDGFFNPFGHEAIVHARLLPHEKPFLTAHELAHLRGYADEGEANLVGFLAMITDRNARYQYSGWLALWAFIETPEFNQLLDPGPRQDLLATAERVRLGRSVWVSRVQTIVLDTFLQANRVPGGVRSYDRIVYWAVATRPRWAEFEEIR